MSLYVKLFHGRPDPNQDMNDWGEDGPVFGPYDYVHTTYGCDIKMCDDKLVRTDSLMCTKQMIYYDGMYYGDWSVFPTDTFESSPQLQSMRKIFN